MAPWLDRIGDWNPQLFRELKGRFRRRNVAIACGTSFVAQVMMWMFYIAALPNLTDYHRFNGYTEFSRFCTGERADSWRSTYECFLNSDKTAWQINWQLWNFDLFIALSIVGMGVLLIIGSHLISADLYKEEKRGTFGFVRLSPQSAFRIILGKILGVPSLLYLGIALALPFHLIAGLAGGISLPWIAMVDFMAIAACITSFTLAAMVSFVGREFFGGFQAWLYSGGLGFYLMMMTILSFDGNFPSDTPFDWIRIIYPGNIFYYLVDVNSFDADVINHFHPYEWFETQWFHSTTWTAGFLGIGVILAHYFVITAIAYQGIERRFYEPQATLISKKNAYAVALLSTFMATGFAAVGGEKNYLFDNFSALQLVYLCLFFTLILLMTPTRQRVQDWARFRKQGRYGKSLVADLLWGDRSPALAVIAVMLVTSTGIITLVAATNPFLDDKFRVIQGLILQAGFLFLCACIVQFIFLLQKKRGLLLTISLGTVTLIPFIVCLIFEHRFPSASLIGLFSAFPMVATTNTITDFLVVTLAGQWLGFVAGTVILKKRIHRLGQSEIKTLLTSSSEPPKNVLS